MQQTFNFDELLQPTVPPLLVVPMSEQRDGKYTLQPLINEGADSLAPDWDDTGVVEAKLVELYIARSNQDIRMEILRGDDIPM